ncbi:MAG: cytochrome c oxidase subunit II [Aggregatilineales bacterium]
MATTQNHERARLHIPNPGVIVLFLMGMAGFGVLIAALQYLVLPEQASVQAQATDRLLQVLLLIGAMIFFLVEGLLLYSVIVFRAKANDTTDGTPIHGNATLEIIWTLIPALIVFVLAILSFVVWENNIAPQDNPNAVDGQSLQVSAVGQRYLWSFEYSFEADVPVQPEDGENAAAAGAELTPEAESTADAAEDMPEATDVPASADDDNTAMDAEMTPEAETTPDAEAVVEEPEEDTRSLEERLEGLETERQTLSISSSTLYTYIGQNIEITMTSPDVIHSLWIPAMRIKQDVLPGYTTEVRFTPVEVPGTEYPAEYPIRCTELCGGGHGDMIAKLVVFENEQQYLDNFFAPERLAKVFPPDDPVLLGEALLSSGVYACAGCHALDSLGWAGLSGPAQNGIATRADEVVPGFSAEEYIMQSIRQPQAVIASPGGWGANMPVFQNEDPAGSNYMSNDDLIAVVAYLCTEADGGESDCTLDFDDPAALVARLEELAALYD